MDPLVYLRIKHPNAIILVLHTESKVKVVEHSSSVE